MLPPPPGLFSTTAVWLRLACKPVAISRATTSLEPPGVNGTMMRIVLLGKPAEGCWARPASGQATEQKAEDPAAAPASSVMNSRRFIRSPRGKGQGACARLAQTGRLAGSAIPASAPDSRGIAAFSAGRRSPALLAQEIEHRRLRQHRFGNAVALGAGALLRGLRCLQISPEMARTLNDALSDREPRH